MVNFFKILKNKIFKKNKQSILKNIFLEKIKSLILVLNSKILFFTDKIVFFYNKYIDGKPTFFFNLLKKLIVKLLEYLKKAVNFVVAFYKKDKKRAVIYFIILYVLYSLIGSLYHRITTLLQKHKNEMIVSVREVAPERVNKEVNCYGYIESENNLQYVSEVRGNIDKILVQEKQHVKAGQLLMVLDSKFTANNYTSAKSILESKRFQYNAIKKLYQDGLESKGNLKSMEADLENANSNFESAKKAYNGLMIYAPFDGYIDNINNKEGSQINPGTKLFTLERMNAMQVKCEVQNLLTTEVNIGDEVKIFVSGYEMAKGKIAVIGDSIDVYTGSRTILVNKIKGLEGFDDKIRPGMSVIMKITAKSQEDTFKISSEALETTDTGAFMVKILNPKNGEISTKNIWIYNERDGVDYVLGLQNGDYVVERGHEFVFVGEKDIKFAKINEENNNDFKLNISEKINFIIKEVKTFIQNMPDFYTYLLNNFKKKYASIKDKILNTIK